MTVPKRDVQDVPAADTSVEGPRTRRRRRSPRWKAAFVAVLIAAVLATAAWMLLGSRILVVRQIEVSGQRLVPKDRLLAASGVRVGEPLIKINTGTVRNRIEGVQEVETARVERNWPATVRIVVRERTPVVVIQRGNGFLQIDRYGVTVLTSAARPRGLPTLSVANPVPTDPALRAGLAVVRDLPPWLGGRVVSVEAPSPEAVTLRLSDGTSVGWGAPERTQAKVRILTGLLKRAPRRGVTTIDVSAPEVVTTK